MTIDQAFIAAILTVIGYSINDTVVVFDRIREFMGLYSSKSKDALFIGIIVGTYSSVFIATPIMSDLSGDLKPKKAKKGSSTESAFKRRVVEP